MLKKIFKAAKDIIKSPVGQLGIGLLAPQLSFLKGVSPALIQGGIGLLSGAKPRDVLQGLALGTAQAGLLGGQGGISDFFRGQPQVAASSIAPASVQPTTGGSMTISPNVKGTGFTIGDASATGYSANSMTPNTFADMSTSLNLTPTNTPAASQGILRDMGLIVDTVTDEITGKPRAANFFEKYGSILKLGGVGAQIAAAALGAEDAAKLYDPEKNPYLKSGTGSKDFYEGINPIYSAKGGGISDFPRKTGMIDGPGDGQSDDIPAMLSDGEFVMTKQAVMAAGNGDRDKGTKQMYAMMNGLEDKAKEMGIGKF